MQSLMNGCRLAAEASAIIRILIRPMPGPSACAATTTKALLDFCRPPITPSAKAPDEGLVHFDPAAQPVPVWSDHRPPQFMQPGPGRLVTAQPQHPLQPKRARPLFLARPVPTRG